MDRRALGNPTRTGSKARVFLEDKDTITTWLVSSVKFLRDRRDLAKKIADANVELTKWIQQNEPEAQKLLIEELKAETQADFQPDAVAQAWRRIQFTSDVFRDLIAKSVQDGKDAGLKTWVNPVEPWLMTCID